MIPFNVPPCVGTEGNYIARAIKARKISGGGEFDKKCSRFFEERMSCHKALLTTSCTHALELAALLAGIGEGDEVIMPSFTFSSTANAFALRGAAIVFTDIRADTMNLDERLIEAAVTPMTKAIVPVHYAGVACEMDTITDIARAHNLLVIEDAAQAVGALYKGRYCGTLGDLGCFSFHETKNYSMGEGGALLTDDAAFAERAAILREMGTDRSLFFRGRTDGYSWVDIGSSYLPGELNAAYLCAQLETFDDIMANRLSIWNFYHNQLSDLTRRGYIDTPVVPEACVHNAHMYYIKTRDLAERTRLITQLKERGIYAASHYVPLHSSKAGRRFGRFHGEDIHTTGESARLLRLPLYYGLSRDDASAVVEGVYDFYKKA